MNKQETKYFLIVIACIIGLIFLTYFRWTGFQESINNFSSQDQTINFPEVETGLDATDGEMQEYQVNDDITISFPENWTLSSEDLLSSMNLQTGTEGELLLLVNSFDVQNSPIFLVVEKVKEEDIQNLLKDENCEIIENSTAEHYQFIEYYYHASSGYSIYSLGKVYPTENGTYFIATMGVKEVWDADKNDLCLQVLGSIKINEDILYNREYISNLFSEETLNQENEIEE